MSENRHTALLILEGHIIDSLMLPSIMDMVMDEGGNFTVEELRVGQHKTDTSFCRIQVAAATPRSWTGSSARPRSWARRRRTTTRSSWRRSRPTASTPRTSTRPTT